MFRLHLDTDIGGNLCALAMVLNFFLRMNTWPLMMTAAQRNVFSGRNWQIPPSNYFEGITGMTTRLPPMSDAVVTATNSPSGHAYWLETIRPAPGPEAEPVALLERSIREGVTITTNGPCTNLALLKRRSRGISATARLVLTGGFVSPQRKGFPQWEA